MFHCLICGREYNDNVNLHRHILRSHRKRRRVSESNHMESSVDVDMPGLEHDLHFAQECEDAQEDTPSIPHVQPTEHSQTLTLHSSLSEPPGVSEDVFTFFMSFENDRAEPVFPYITEPVPSPSVLHPWCNYNEKAPSYKKVLSHCNKYQMSMGQCEGQGELVSQLEKDLPFHSRYLTTQFSTSSKFASYVKHVRKWNVDCEGWMKTLLETPFGLNNTGAFRSVLCLMKEEIDSAGGIEEVQAFSSTSRAGQRTYSSPWNAEIMLKYKKHVGEKVVIVLIDLYCDGTILSNSGSQSASTLRVRFSNLNNRSQEWHEVGIAPCVDMKDVERSSLDLGRERIQLFQRFLFLALKDLIEASRAGIVVEETIVVPRIGMIVADQPQERAFFSLKSDDSFRDCSLCDMLFRAPNKDISEEVVQDTQRSNIEASPRNVSKTVRYQLLTAKRRVQGAKPTRALSKEERARLGRAREYLHEFSAHEYPPALAAFRGLGSAPFLLYEVIGFDSLHVLDLGIFRLLPDIAGEVLGSDRECIHSGAKSVAIANQRMVDIAGTCRVPKLPPFLVNRNERLAGMTGAIRRKQCPLLWTSLIGVSNRRPDDDPLVQAALEMAQVQSELFGVNRSPEAAVRTSADIDILQFKCFKLGLSLIDGLGIKMNTKIHRLMRHVKSHLLSFGCIRRGATDANERMHKATKKAYQSTNKHRTEITSQLLSSRSSAMQESKQIPINKSMLNVSFASTPISFKPTALLSSPTKKAEPEIFCSKLCETIKNYSSIHDAVDMLSCVPYNSNPTKYLQKRCELSVDVRFEWWPEQSTSGTRHNIRAGENILNRAHHDAVQYRIGEYEYTGIVQSLFVIPGEKDMKFALLRRLIRAEAQNGNVRVVHTFNLRRWKYELSANEQIHLDCIPLSNIRRPTVLVPDLYALKESGIARENIKKAYCIDEHHKPQFFSFIELSTYPYTTIAESYC
ncbi:hypothetical protein FGB62_7g37 [Gracilaria domingensis]|nr:hypothetical protein FGB62_7g37 [Gracilaria domingensis]